jgi:hypothetical protein
LVFSAAANCFCFISATLRGGPAAAQRLSLNRMLQ